MFGIDAGELSIWKVTSKSGQPTTTKRVVTFGRTG
jgi:hypothetical protein